MRRVNVDNDKADGPDPGRGSSVPPGTGVGQVKSTYALRPRTETSKIGHCVPARIQRHPRSLHDVVTAQAGPVAGAPSRPSPRPVFRHVASSLSTVYLTAGEQLTVTPLRRMRPVRTNVTDTIAWVHHKLIFASTALRDVVQEFNRYNARQLVIASPSLETFKIDGVFSSTNPNSLIAFLRQYPGIQVTDTGESVVISRQ